jgi:hypothetical protein
MIAKSEGPTLADIMTSLPGRFRPEYAGKMACVIQFDFLPPKVGQWILKIVEGECLISRGEAANPDAKVIMEAGDFVGINTGTVSAPSLFWSGGIQVEGSLDAVIDLSPVMGWQ